ncbi:SidA/IucD/PvdA family monooxygenase [Streptomyces stelliscabiei]
MLHTGPDSIYDVLGIGFGPSNLALAIALHEHSAGPAPRTDSGRVPGKATPVRLAPRHAHRRRHHASVLPEGPGDDA